MVYQGQASLNTRIGRAGGLTWRNAFFFYGISTGHCLWIKLKHSFLVLQPLVKPVGNLYGTYLLTISACGTFIYIHITGLLQQLYMKIARFAGYLFHFGHG